MSRGICVFFLFLYLVSRFFDRILWILLVVSRDVQLDFVVFYGVFPISSDSVRRDVVAPLFASGSSLLLKKGEALGGPMPWD